MFIPPLLYNSRPDRLTKMKKLIVVLFLSVACGGSSTSGPNEPTAGFVGTYRLVSYSGLSVPTASYGVSCIWRGANIVGSACSNPAQGCCYMQDIAAGQLMLRPDGTYSLALTQADGTQVPEVGFLYPGLVAGTWGWRSVSSNESILFIRPGPSSTPYCCTTPPEDDAFASDGLTSSKIPFAAGQFESMVFVR